MPVERSSAATWCVNEWPKSRVRVSLYCLRATVS